MSLEEVDDGTGSPSGAFRLSFLALGVAAHSPGACHGACFGRDSGLDELLFGLGSGGGGGASSSTSGSVLTVMVTVCRIAGRSWSGVRLR